jgi:hypothetical protein
MRKIIFILVVVLCSAAGKPKLSRDFSLQKLKKVDFEKLKLVDSLDYIYVLEREHCSSSEYYYYSVIDTTKYNSYVYFYFSIYPGLVMLAVLIVLSYWLRLLHLVFFQCVTVDLVGFFVVLSNKIIIIIIIIFVVVVKSSNIFLTNKNLSDTASCKNNPPRR